MVSIVVGSIIMSPMLGYQHRDATMYCEERSMPLLACLLACCCLLACIYKPQLIHSCRPELPQPTSTG